MKTPKNKSWNRKKTQTINLELIGSNLETWAVDWIVCVCVCVSRPPPKMVRGSFTVCANTHSASCSERSASSRICCVAPRRTTVHASPVGNGGGGGAGKGRGSGESLILPPGGGGREGGREKGGMQTNPWRRRRSGWACPRRSSPPRSACSGPASPSLGGRRWRWSPLLNTHTQSGKQS